MPKCITFPTFCVELKSNQDARPQMRCDTLKLLQTDSTATRRMYVCSVHVHLFIVDETSANYVSVVVVLVRTVL